MSFSKVEAALQALRSGGFVVVADDAARENEGDLIIAAEKVSAKTLAFMLRYTSGVVCVAITEARANSLELPLMVPENNESQRTAFTVSVDFRHGTTTGISAADRSAAIRALAAAEVGASGFLRPGHVFPLRARAGGVLERQGHTEAAVDLAVLAGLAPAGALCELVDEEGGMLRGRDLEGFAAHHGLPFLHIEELVRYRKLRERIEPSATRRTDRQSSELVHEYCG
jgi:3,4-dihydroxy 2-butanone 4-phosphate synthase/GTP cyclohydrolase II